MAMLDTVGPIERALLLRGLEPFAALRPAQVATIAQLAGERGLRAGAEVLRAGAAVRALTILLEGRVRLQHGDGRREELEAPQALALLALLAETPAPATVVAATPLTLLCIEAPVWWDLLEEDFALLVHLRTALGRQLAAAGAADAIAPPPATSAAPFADDVVGRLCRLHSVPALRPFGIAVLAALLRDEDERRFAAGEPLLRAGTPAGELFVVLAGTVECPGARPPRLGAGALLGANAALSGLAHAGDVVAASPVRAIAIDAARLWDIAEDHFHVARALLAQAAQRALRLAAASPGAPPEVA